MERERFRFSMGWVLVSYLMVCGGFMLTAIAIGLAGLTGAWTGYASFGGGALIGGFFAGRASPHRSVIEAAVGGLLMVVTLVGFFAATPLGPLLYSVAPGEVVQTTALYAALCLAGGLAGAVLGEKSRTGAPSPGWLRWLGLSTLINLGSMFACMVGVFALMVRQAVAEAEAGLTSRMDGEAAATAFIVALALAAFLGGLVTQAAAPARRLLAAGLGAFVALFGVGLLTVTLAVTTTGAADRELEHGIVGAAVMGGAAGIVGIVGAAVGWALVRGRKAVA